MKFGPVALTTKDDRLLIMANIGEVYRMYLFRKENRICVMEEPKETTISLDGKKQVRVKEFKGVKLVDIREYYVDRVTKTEKPGKRGISLTEAVWKKLIENKDNIQQALDKLSSDEPPEHTSDDIIVDKKDD